MFYRIHLANDMGQQWIPQITENIEGAKNSQDSIIIWGENSNELQQQTIKFLEPASKHGLKSNISKCQFDQSEIIFVGHKITAEGIHPDHSKVEVILKMPYPSDIKGLQCFLDMVNYLAKFIPNLSSHTKHLCKLEKGSVRSFENILRQEIDILKRCITIPPVLKFFDSKLPTKISCDASLKGLRAVLEQKHNQSWYSIRYPSRSLTSAERNCCQLKKEILSTVFACHKFHDFIYGKKI